MLAAGVHSAALLEDLGVHLPIRTAAVTVVRSAPAAPCLGPVIGVAGADLAVRQQIDGRFRFTGGAEMPHLPMHEVGGRPRVPVRAASLAGIIGRAIDVIAAIADIDVESSWGGLLDMTPDALPVLDRVDGIDGLVVAAGFSGHGFGIGPAVGPCLAALALDRAPPLALGAFALGRFGAGRNRPVDAPCSAGARPERLAAAPTLHG